MPKPKAQPKSEEPERAEAPKPKPLYRVTYRLLLQKKMQHS
jgi:hypothetical protein